MTTQSNKKNISEVLLSNSQIKNVQFNQRNFNPTNRGHGLFVETDGKDIVIDLRLSSQKPFWGHSHPLLVQHNNNLLDFDLKLNNYSTSKTEFTRMIETFQKVDLSDILTPNFEITYTNVVITIDESILNFSKKKSIKKLGDLISNNPSTFFWIVEKDIILLNEKDLFYFEKLMDKNHVHLCLDLHFINSIFIYSHHLFSEDSNIQIFLAIKNLTENIISTRRNGKNGVDFKVIDDFFDSDYKSSVLSRQGRYLLINSKIEEDKFNKNGIISSGPCSNTNTTILALPIACTKNELLDTLERIKLSI